MNERYIKWYTPYLSREFEMLVFGEKSGLPLILFPTSGARYYENKDFGLVGSLAWYIDNGKVTVYCPDAIDLESFYNKSIHPARQNADAQRVRKCDRSRRVRSRAT
jgi:esterase/lipase superfamily enzyme